MGITVYANGNYNLVQLISITFCFPAVIKMMIASYIFSQHIGIFIFLTRKEARTCSVNEVAPCDHFNSISQEEYRKSSIHKNNSKMTREIYWYCLQDFWLSYHYLHILAWLHILKSIRQHSLSLSDDRDIPSLLGTTT